MDRPRAAWRRQGPTAWPAVKSTDGAIGYVEWSLAENDGLKIAQIDNGAGEFAELTAESAGKTIAGAEVAGAGQRPEAEDRLRRPRRPGRTRSSW